MAPGAGHGYEFNLVLIGALVSLMLTGPGALSFDRHRARAAETQAFGRARMRTASELTGSGFKVQGSGFRARATALEP